MNNEQITEIAMLATFLNDNEISELAKNIEFQNFISQQKRVLSVLIKNSYALSRATSNIGPNSNLNSQDAIRKTEPIVHTAKSKIYIPDVTAKSSETLIVADDSQLKSQITSLPTPQQTQTQIEPSVTRNQEVLLREIVQLFADKTGYPSDMLEPKLDLEADLGIDTVKQMEILGQIRQKYNIRLKEGFSLKQTPNIDSIVNLVIAG